jgi:glycyl-tRNA synthetase beta chain
MTAPLLVELLVEELPPKSLARLGEAFAAGIVDGLRREGLLGSDGHHGFATPRRLAVLVEAVRAQAADRDERVKLMPAAVGFAADGTPTPALARKLAALGATTDADGIERAPDPAAKDGKGAEQLWLARRVPGATLAAGLQRTLDATLAGLPIAKVMAYQLADGWTNVAFVRPAQGLLALHGTAVVAVSALGLDAGRTTRGHRFEARLPAIELAQAGDYERRLREEGAVVASFAARRAEVVAQLETAAAGEGLSVDLDPALLDEVTALVEWPNVVACGFDAEFLEVPAECLVLTMKANQRYFPLSAADGRLANRFLVVANIRPADPSRIVAGNERVVRPRLADARFFFEVDARERLESRLSGLDAVVYHGKLGSQGARLARVRQLAARVAAWTGADAALVDRAALLAKADLQTQMVGEFPELQGVMGAHYAARDGEVAEVVAAIREQYRHGRRLDGTAVGGTVAEALRIADRAESLVGLWGVGAKPSGDKDPQALRRAALTLIGALERAATEVPLKALLEAAAATFQPPIALAAGTVAEVESFVRERHANVLAAEEGTDPRTVDAVLALAPPVRDVAARIGAVHAFRALPEAPALAAANKRVGNILKKAEAGTGGTGVDPALLEAPEERALASALDRVLPVADARFAAGDLTGALAALAALREPVDAFFDRVMVNADDPALRTNRLALLASLHRAMNRVADLSRLAA